MSPLDGMRVLDLGHIFNAPYAGVLLAGLGADVVKIEPPAGETLRGARLRPEPSQTFKFVNSGKRGLVLDLKQPRGREIFLRLVAHADIVLENFGPGVMERLGLGYDVLAAQNSRIIVAGSKGYGTGPYSDYVATDITVQAMSGFIDATGFPDGPPVKAGPAVADVFAAVHLAAGVLGAIVDRFRTGKGQYVEVAMLDSCLPALTAVLGAWQDSGGTSESRTGNHSPRGNIAYHNVYATADGWIAIMAISARHWIGLCEVIGRPDLGADETLQRGGLPRHQRSDEIDAVISEFMRVQHRDAIFEELQRAGVPSAPIMTPPDILEDKHLRERGSIQSVYDSTGRHSFALGSPFRYSRSQSVPPVAAPALGEHSGEVLHEWLGLDASEVEELRRENVI